MLTYSVLKKGVHFSGDFEMLKNAVPFAIDWFTVIWETMCIFRMAVRGRELQLYL